MPPGLALGLFASLGWGFTDLTGALGGRRVGSLRVLAGAQAVSVAMLLAIAAADPSRWAGDALPGFATGLVLGIGAAVAYLSSYTALRIGPLSVVSPVIGAYGGATVVLAVVVRGEVLLPLQALGVALATAGVVLAGIVFHGGSLRGARVVGPGVVLAVVTLVLFAVLTVALAGPIKAHGWLPVILGSRLANAATAIVLLVAARRSGDRRLDPLLRPAGPLDRRSVGLVAAAGVSDLAAFVAYAVGLEVSTAWLVGIASSFGPLIPLLFAIWRLGERPRRTQWLGLAFIAAGVVVLATAG